MNKSGEAFLNARKLPYKHLPAEVVEKAVEVITRIEAGEADRELEGKRDAKGSSRAFIP